MNNDQLIARARFVARMMGVNIDILINDQNIVNIEMLNKLESTLFKPVDK